MRMRRRCLTVIVASAPAATAAVLGAIFASPAQLHADPGVGGCVDAVGVSACTSADINVPNINSLENVVPDVHVPNINMPNVKVNPGHVGLPGRGR